jgi:hypothetical protein
MKITEEMIRLKAYELWQADGMPTGSAEKDWFTAQALLQKNSQSIADRNQLTPNGLRKLTSD